MKFTIKKIPLSEEEKRERAEFYVEETGDDVDIESFVKRDIFDEFIDFKCLKCGHEEELEADIVFEMYFSDIEEYPIFTCPKCGKEKFVPLDIFNQLKKK